MPVLYISCQSQDNYGKWPKTLVLRSTSYSIIERFLLLFFIWITMNEWWHGTLVRMPTVWKGRPWTPRLWEEGHNRPPNGSAHQPATTKRQQQHRRAVVRQACCLRWTPHFGDRIMGWGTRWFYLKPRQRDAHASKIMATCIESNRPLCS